MYVFIHERTVHIQAPARVLVVVADQQCLHEVLLVLGVIVLHYLLNYRLDARDELLEVDRVRVVEDRRECPVGNWGPLTAEVRAHLVA